MILQLREIPQIYGDTLLNKLRYVNSILYNFDNFRRRVFLNWHFATN
ncbi:hypothetical protein MYAER_1060 [Microcystis aeruginosa NIES-2549]|uniref:Uncharacterized protein n=1 Tax=Microcystis aeruginosa NIES-2549 TaxID=1641812 RepID=A0A0F6RKE3_MICAE|nr:hypothetical protein MYAER_1060 [Microcystis aeruginosa NIES-2549]AOC51811.1 hypothetical protein amyaer_1074 [Microcystis aeruginosa NIES-2481]